MVWGSNFAARGLIRHTVCLSAAIYYCLLVKLGSVVGLEAPVVRALAPVVRAVGERDALKECGTWWNNRRAVRAEHSNKGE